MRPSPIPGRFPGLSPQAGGRSSIGTLAGLREVKNLPACSSVPPAACSARVRLVIVGEGPERATIETAAERDGHAGSRAPARVPARAAPLCRLVRHHGAFVDERAIPDRGGRRRWRRAFPIVARDVGDIPTMVAAANRPYICRRAPRSPPARRDADAGRRRANTARLSARQNRAKAVAEYDEQVMIAALCGALRQAIGSAGDPGLSRILLA